MAGVIGRLYWREHPRRGVEMALRDVAAELARPAFPEFTSTEVIEA